MILKQFNLENIKITFKVDGIETSVVGEKDKTVLDSAIDNDIDDAPTLVEVALVQPALVRLKMAK